MAKVSVIIPTYNRAKYISRAIDSVLAQTYKDWELIIVDDGSTDNTREVVEPYLKDKRIKYVWKQNGGVSSARNKGLDIATGEFVAFLDSDDFYMPEKLEKSLKVFTEYLDVVLVAHTVVNFLDDRSSFREILEKKSFGRALDMVSYGYIPPHEIRFKMFGSSLTHLYPSNVVVRYVDCIKKIRFNEHIWAGEDWLYFCNVVTWGAVFVIDFPLSAMMRGHECLTSSSWKRLKFYKALEQTIPLAVNVAAESFLKKCELCSLSLLDLSKLVRNSLSINRDERLKYANWLLLKAVMYNPFNLYIYKHVIGDILLKKWRKK